METSSNGKRKICLRMCNIASYHYLNSLPVTWVCTNILYKCQIFIKPWETIMALIGVYWTTKGSLSFMKFHLWLWLDVWCDWSLFHNVVHLQHNFLNIIIGKQPPSDLPPSSPSYLEVNISFPWWNTSPFTMTRN